MAWKLGNRVEVSRFSQMFTGRVTGIFWRPGKPIRIAVQADGSHPWCSLVVSERFVTKSKRRRTSSTEALQKMGYYGPIASGRKKPPNFNQYPATGYPLPS